MKSIVKFRLFLVFIVLSGCLTLVSCSRKSGCPAVDKAEVKIDKRGNYKVGKTKSGLFPKR